MTTDSSHRVPSGRIRSSSDRDSPPTARTIAVLEYLATLRDTTATPAQIAEHVQISRSTCRAILAALERSGYVTRHAETRNYRVGPGVVALGRAAREHDPLLRIVSGILQGLNEELHVGCSVTARRDDDLLIVERIGGPQQFADAQHSGVRLPFAAPFGGAFAAFCTDVEVDIWLDRGGASDDERDGMHAMLYAIRAHGYFVQPISARGQLGLLSVIDEIVNSGHVTSERAHHAALLSEMVSATRPNRAAPSHFPASTISVPVMGPDGGATLAAVLQVPADGLDRGNLDELGQRVKALMASASAVVYG